MLYDAGPLTLFAFLTKHLDHQSTVELNNCDKLCPLGFNVMCDYKVLACHLKTHTCGDLAKCEAAVRIRLCGHVVGARCLVQHILAGKNECPTCIRIWFKPAVKYIRDSFLEYSKLWSWCSGWDLVHDQD